MEEIASNAHLLHSEPRWSMYGGGLGLAAWRLYVAPLSIHSRGELLPTGHRDPHQWPLLMSSFSWTSSSPGLQLEWIRMDTVYTISYSVFFFWSQSQTRIVPDIQLSLLYSLCKPLVGRLDGNYPLRCLFSAGSIGTRRVDQQLANG